MDYILFTRRKPSFSFILKGEQGFPRVNRLKQTRGCSVCPMLMHKPHWTEVQTKMETSAAILKLEDFDLCLVPVLADRWQAELPASWWSGESQGQGQVMYKLTNIILGWMPHIFHIASSWIFKQFHASHAPDKVCHMLPRWTILYSVKCYSDGRKMHFIRSITEIPSQKWYHCVQYTKRHHMSLTSHC